MRCSPNALPSRPGTSVSNRPRIRGGSLLGQDAGNLRALVSLDLDLAVLHCATRVAGLLHSLGQLLLFRQAYADKALNHRHRLAAAPAVCRMMSTGHGSSVLVWLPFFAGIQRRAFRARGGPSTDKYERDYDENSAPLVERDGAARFREASPGASVTEGYREARTVLPLLEIVAAFARYAGPAPGLRVASNFDSRMEAGLDLWLFRCRGRSDFDQRRACPSDGLALSTFLRLTSSLAILPMTNSRERFQLAKRGSFSAERLDLVLLEHDLGFGAPEIKPVGQFLAMFTPRSRSPSNDLAD